MPYRRLPNTDSSRLKALEMAYDKTKDLNPYDKPFSQSTDYKLIPTISKFDAVLRHRKETYKQQTKSNAEYIHKFKKARNYVSHFLQVLNLAIIRGDLKNDARTYFKLKKDDTKIPVLKSEQDVLKWGNIIKEGESQRIMNGGNPMTNPTIGITIVHYEKFVAAHNHQKTLQGNSNRASNAVAKLRDEIDEIILTLWNEIEEHFSDINEIDRRNICREYGIVYFFRRNEEIDERENVPESYRKNRVVDKLLREKNKTEEKEVIKERQEVESEFKSEEKADKNQVNLEEEEQENVLNEINKVIKKLEDKPEEVENLKEEKKTRKKKDNTEQIQFSLF